MKNVDEHNRRDKLLDGILKVEKKVEGLWTPYHEEEFNLVVAQASYILRDLMFGGSEVITKIEFGDMGLNPQTDDLRNVDDPNIADTELTNKLYEKAITKSVVDYGSHPAIKYEVILEREEFNGSGEQLITEFALATDNNRIFTRKTRASIFKDNETSFKFTWYLVFNAG